MRRFVPGLPTRLLTVACPSWLLTGKKTSRTSLRTARFSVSSASLQMPNTSQVRRWLASLRPRPTFSRRFARVVSRSVALLATSMLGFRDLPISWILPVAGAGIGVGIVFYALIQGTSRNPSVKNQLFQYAVLGFALSEATGLFALMVSFMILFS